MPCSCCCSLLEEIYFPRPAPYYAFLTHIHSQENLYDTVQISQNLSRSHLGHIYKKQEIILLYILFADSLDLTSQIFK